MSDHALDQIVADMLAASDRWRRLHPPTDPTPARTWLEDHMIFARVCDESSKDDRSCPACWEPLTTPTVTSDGATIHAACADEREWRPDKEADR